MISRQPNNVRDLIYKGTTTVGIVCKDGIVLGTDTRVTMGHFVAHKQGKKIYRIDNHLAVTIAGIVGDAQTVVEILKANANLYRLNVGRPMPVKTAARMTANLLYNSRAYPLILQALIAGVDDQGGQIIVLDPLGSLIEEKCVSTGSGSPIAYGVLEDGYRDNIKVTEGIKLVVRAVSSAMKRDIASGDSMDVASITEEGFKMLNEEEKAASGV